MARRMYVYMYVLAIELEDKTLLPAQLHWKRDKKNLRLVFFLFFHYISHTHCTCTFRSCSILTQRIQ